MTERIHRFRRWGHRTLTAALFLLAGGALLLWSWNTLAIELFEAPAAKFKHALAFEAALATITALAVLVARGLRRPTGDSR